MNKPGRRDIPPDRLARAYFGNLTVMRRFLQGFLPPAVSDALDYDSLHDARETFLTPGLRQSVVDLIFHCRSRDGEGCMT